MAYSSVDLSLFHINDDHEPAPTLQLGIVVRGVVRNMAMDQPFSGLARFPNNIIALTRPHINGVGKKTRGGRDRLAVASNDFERSTVNVHRMDKSVVRSDEPDLKRLTDRH